MTGGADHYSGTVAVGDGEVVVRVAGIVQSPGTGLFLSLIDEAVAVGAPVVVVDMTDVALLDAAAVTVLVDTAGRLSSRGARLEVRGVTPRIYLRLQIFGVVEALGVQRPPAVSPALVHGHRGVLPKTPQARAVLDAALKLVVTMAQAVVVGADGVSITLPRDGHLGTVAASNDVVLDMDHDQYDTGEGPCLDAATEGQRFHIDSLGNEQRWPAFVPRARARGIETILSAPLVSADRPIGALNLYSRTVGAFAEHEKRWADQFAVETSAVVASALPDASVEIDAEEVQLALLSREVIAQAQGVIIHRDGLSPAAAYAVLRDIGGRTGEPLRDVCQRVVSSGGATKPNREPGDGSADGQPSA